MAIRRTVPCRRVQPRFQGLSGLGLVLYALTVSFAAVDWVMSLDPTWGSTIYGLIFIAGQGLSALAFNVIMLTVFTRYRPYREIIKPMQFHDIGKLMLAFVMLFAYFSFSQWLIIWAGNLPEEIGWYLHRIRGGWGVVALIIILFHFALPFALLLSRERKRAGRRLIGLALLLMFMRLVDIYWYVVPNFAHEQGHFYLSIWYIVAPIGVGGLWLAFFFYNLQQRPLLPLYEPQIPTSCSSRGAMATENSNYDPLRNPQVDFDRTDLSPRGILLFLIGLLICGVIHRAGAVGHVPIHGQKRRSLSATAEQSHGGFAAGPSANGCALDLSERAQR